MPPMVWSHIGTPAIMSCEHLYPFLQTPRPSPSDFKVSVCIDLRTGWNVFPVSTLGSVPYWGYAERGEKKGLQQRLIKM